MFKRILLAVDGSEASARAADAAAALAAGSDVEVRALHVREVDVARSGEHGEEGTGEAAVLVSDVVAALRERGVRAHGETHSTTAGRVAPSIITAARELDADLVVLGTRGRSDFASLLVGSVAHKVIHHVHCAVLVTR